MGMLVDDEEAFVQTMVKRLGKRGLQGASALSGDAALGHLKTHRNVDVVILDVTMPGKVGMATLQQIKADPLLTDWNMGGDRTWAPEGASP
mgnify:CR=1 FL=1